jgi:hypothetical protein
MRFETPAPGIVFHIPDEWWAFAELEHFTPADESYRPDSSDCQVLPLRDILPPARSGVPEFVKAQLIPVLFAFQSGVALPHVRLIALPEPGRYRYDVHDGFHRYYASVAVGFTHLPARVFPPSVLAAI